MTADAPLSSVSQDRSEGPKNAATSSVRPGRYLILPLVGVVGALTAWFAWQAPQSLLAVLILVAAWHAVRRLLTLARHLADREEPSSGGAAMLEWAVCVLWIGAAVLFSAQRIDVLLFAAYRAGMPLIPATWIQGLQLLWGLTLAAVTSVFLIHYLWQRVHGVGEGAFKLALFATSFAMWWYAMMGVDDIMLGLLLFEIFHLVQGLAIVWRLGAAGGQAPGGVTALYGRTVFWFFVYLVVFSAYGIALTMGRIPPEGFDAAHTAVRVLLAIAAAALVIQYLFDDRFFLQLKQMLPAGVAGEPAVGLAPQLGNAMMWGGALLVAGWLAMGERAAEEMPIEVYDNVVSAIPGSWKAHAGFARALLKQGQLPVALEELTESAKLNPDVVPVRIELGRALRALDRIDEAAEEFRRAIVLNPESWIAHRELGKTLFSQGKVEEGFARLKYTLELRPQDAIAHLEIALAQARMGDLDSALASFNKATSLDPELAVAFNGRGNVLWSKGEFDAALKDYNEALRLNPASAKAYRNRAGVWLDKRDPQKALADLTAAIELDGTASLDFVRRGDLYYALQQFDKALEDYEAAAEREQQYTVPIERLVTLWTTCPDETLRSFDLAMSAAQAACQMTEWKSPDALQMLAGVFAAQGKYAEAVQWQTQAVELARGDAKETLQSQLDSYRKLGESPAKESGSPGS